MSLRAHALQTESRTAHRSIGTSQKGTGLLNLILIKTGTNMFAVLTNGHTVGTLRRETINRKHMWVKGQNVCLARRVAGVRFGLFECRLSGCSRCR